ncbi:MAG: tetratricopeptide repeat protein, partial [Actinomycetota bacterium]|nr:tetratricopeptide repeat protein [Actinomycetota bacterium]
MSVPSFSRPGAVDLSALKQPSSGGSAVPGTAPAAGPGTGTGAYRVELDENNFQTEVQRSLEHPVVLSFWSPQVPASVELNATLERLADEFDGRVLLATVDVDAHPRLAQAVGVPGAPLVGVALGGQLAPIAQEAVPEAELRQVLQQVVQTAVANGMTGRAQPRVRPGGAEGGEPAEPEAQGGDPRYADAERALMAGDLDGAAAAYQKVLSDHPADDGARVGLARVQLVARTRGMDLAAVRQAAAADPTDVAAQISAADADLVGGHVDDAFDRLVQTVARTAGDDRERARA